MSNRAWMPLHVADYLQDTGHLTAIEHGAYLLLIMHYWKDGGLPSDEGMIRRLAKLDAAQWAESRDVIASLFVDGWRHKRIDAELAKADEIISKRRAAAEQKHSKQSANAVHMQSTCTDTRVPTNNLEPTTSSLRSDDTRAKARSPREELKEVLDEERASAVVEYRQRARKPLTAYGARKLAAQLAKWHDPNEAADEMIAAGWSGFKSQWMVNRQRGQGPPGKRMNAVEANLSLRAQDHEPSSERRDYRDVELLPADQPGLPSPVADLGKAFRWPDGSGHH